MKTVVTYETQHGSAKRLAETIAKKVNGQLINIDTPYFAENTKNFDNLIICFGFRGPYTAQLTKLYLQKMQGKLANKNVIVCGEGLFSDKEFPVVAKGLEDLAKPLSFNTFFMKGQLRMTTLTFEEQHLLDDFAKLTGMTITDMGEFQQADADKIADGVEELLNKATIVEDKPVKQWICSICGYIHTGDNPPEKCPMCQQPGSVFKLKEQ